MVIKRALIYCIISLIIVLLAGSVLGLRITDLQSEDQLRIFNLFNQKKSNDIKILDVILEPDYEVERGKLVVVTVILEKPYRFHIDKEALELVFEIPKLDIKATYNFKKDLNNGKFFKATMYLNIPKRARYRRYLSETNLKYRSTTMHYFKNLRVVSFSEKRTRPDLRVGSILIEPVIPEINSEFDVIVNVFKDKKIKGLKYFNSAVEVYDEKDRLVKRCTFVNDLKDNLFNGQHFKNKCIIEKGKLFRAGYYYVKAIADYSEKFEQNNLLFEKNENNNVGYKEFLVRNPSYFV